MPEAESRGAVHTAAALGTHRVSADGECELTEVTPRYYCTDTTTRMACRRTEKGKEEEPLTRFFLFLH